MIHTGKIVYDTEIETIYWVIDDGKFGTRYQYNTSLCTVGQLVYIASNTVIPAIATGVSATAVVLSN